MSIICKLCNKQFEDMQGLSHHLSSIHQLKTNLAKKSYYDKYIKKSNEVFVKLVVNLLII